MVMTIINQEDDPQNLILLVMFALVNNNTAK
jgi:hypothetical protein